MRYPYIDNIQTSKDMVTNFQGLNANLTSCKEGEFFDCKNITTQYYPVLSTRNQRGTIQTFTNLQGILDKESLIWIDNGTLYVDGVEKLTGISEGEKTLAKMGAYVIIMPDRIWVNCEKEVGDEEQTGNMEASVETTSAKITFTPCKADGDPLTNVHTEDYYKTTAPKSNDIMLTYTNEGKASYKVYSELTNMWSTITTTYFGISIEGQTMDAFKEGDGIKISIQPGDSWEYADKVFVNKEDDGWMSLNGYIHKKKDNILVIVGLLDGGKELTIPIKIERKTPDLAYITECQNRLWGCSMDGHEIYCCKLGDVTNWNYFSGTAIDSYAATVGSDGKFTGAVTFNNNPIFFKEHSYLKVTVSATGAHSYREQVDNGVQEGSSRSICIVNGVLMYKGVSDVYAYDGSYPMVISQNLGEHRYYDAVGGTINGRYYLSMKDTDGKPTLFVFDSAKGLWAKEDDSEVRFFCTNKDRLLFVVGNELKDVNGGTEIDRSIKWSAESGYIGFNTSNKKHISKVNICMSLELNSYCDFWLKYDNDTEWKHIWNMSGKGTKTFTVPCIIQRCNHFRYKLTGTGLCKIYTISKTIEEGSDV